MRLSEKQRNEPPVKLTRAEKREIQAIIRKYKGDGQSPFRTGQHPVSGHVPGRDLQGDGQHVQQVYRVCRHQLSACTGRHQDGHFENLCDLYNYLDASIHVQLSFVNRKTDPKQYAKSFEIKAPG